MATEEVSVEVQPQGRANLDIESLVSEPTWKDVLVDLVKGSKFDPWDIDIAVIVDKYIEAVHNMKVVSLRVPANIVLAASILLKYKSDMLIEEEQEQQQIMEEMQATRQSVLVEPMPFRLRIPPRRRITLAELVTALEEAMKLKELKASAGSRQQLDLPIKFSSLDIEAETNRLHEIMGRCVDQNSMLTFNDAVKAVGPEDVLTGLFIPLLFMWHRDMVLLLQEKFFGEIIIVLK